jgi:hypothetical protein
MGRLLRFFLFLIVLGALGGLIYALVADLPPPTRSFEVEAPPASLG